MSQAVVSRNKVAGSVGRLDLAAVGTVLLLALAGTLPLLTKDPIPGGAGPSFVDSAVTFATHGYIGTDLHIGLLPGMQRHVYWQPPLYFLLLGAWFKVFGIGVAQARAFSLLCGLVILAATYLMACRFASELPSAAAALLCAFSPWFLERSKMARMDTLCVALLLLCGLAYLLADQAADRRRAARLYGRSGLLAGLAFLSHPLGIIGIVATGGHLLIWGRREPETRRNAVLLFLPFSLCVLALGVYAAQDPASFYLQMRAQWERRHELGPYWRQFVDARPQWIALAAGLIGVTWMAWAARRLPEYRFLMRFTIVAFLAATIGKGSGYFLYFFPLFCIAFAVVMQRSRFLWLSVVLLALALAGEGRAAWRDYHT